MGAAVAALVGRLGGAIVLLWLAVVLVRLAIVVLGALGLANVLGVVPLAVFRVVVRPGMIRVIARATVIGADIVGLRGRCGLSRSCTLYGNPGGTSIARRRRRWAAAWNSDLGRPARRGEMDDHIRSVGDFGSVRYAHARHV